MLKNFLKSITKIFDPNERELRKLKPILNKVNELEPEVRKLKDEDFPQKTAEFKERISKGESLDSILPEAFALVREVARRKLNMRHFDVQILGGIVLHQGRIAEMKTGEGKTLVATLPAYLNALTGKGVHIVTVNDYLAKRDRFWMGPIYEALGLTVGYIQHFMDKDERRRMYNCDVTYVTNNEIGFDYLRDNMVYNLEDMVLRGLHYAIIDEVDSILIDEARTPLIISGVAEEDTRLYYKFAKIAARLKRDEDYTVDEKAGAVPLTEKGVEKVQKMLGIDNLYSQENWIYAYHINVALKAKELFRRDEHYVVKDGEIIIVDEFTGRLMYGRRYSDGIHQAIEAKEGLRVREESKTLATITFQNFFKMYEKLAGMTGTAATEEEEFKKIYGLDVVVIPTNKPMIRIDHPDLVFKTEKAKMEYVADFVKELYLKERPVLIGTRSIEKSEYLSRLLRKRGVPHQVLNAKHHEREAEIIAQAGRPGAVTVATNMAGRGVDILLGGNPDGLARQELKAKGYDLSEVTDEMWRDALEMAKRGENPTQKYPEPWAEVIWEKVQQCKRDYEKVKALGGLYVIGTERHEARRIDNQLRGRSGRQGDPGESRFFVALEDEIIRLFGGDRIWEFIERFLPGIDLDKEPQSHPLLAKQIENIQKKVENWNFEIRRQLLAYDDVINIQRERIYSDRRAVLEKKDLDKIFLGMLESVADRLALSYFSMEDEEKEREYEEALEDFEEELDELEESAEERTEEESEEGAEETEGISKIDRFMAIVRDYFPPFSGFDYDLLRKRLEEGISSEKELKDLIFTLAKDKFYSKLEGLPKEIADEALKFIILRTIDTKWVDHLQNLETLRRGISLRAWGQIDPVVAFRHEASELFEEMIKSIEDEVVKLFYRMRITVEVAPTTPLFRDMRLGRGEMPGATSSPAQTQGSGSKKPKKYHEFKRMYKIKRR